MIPYSTCYFYSRLRYYFVYCNLTFFSSSFIGHSLAKYHHTIAHDGCDNKGAKYIYRYKLNTVWWCDDGMLQLSTPCLKASREVLYNKGCGRLLHIIIPVGWCSGICYKESFYVTSSYWWSNIQLKRWYCYNAIYYSVHH